MELPFKKYRNAGDNTLNMSEYLNKAKNIMDANVMGNHNVKNEVLKLLCQMKLSGSCSGYALGFEGKPGVGKTHFVKNALAKAMQLPISYIGLGGCTDSSYLEGNLYTYEGSMYGRLAQAIIETKCSNPIIFFDELDKVSSSSKGMELINKLIHVIDPMQNSHIRDKYFGFDIDFSQCIFTTSDSIFGWNWDWPNIGNNVKAYPEIIFGKKPWSSSSTNNLLPIALGRVENFEVEFDIQTEANGNYNSAFEFWITEDSLSNENGITTEVMIWTSNSFLHPAGNQISIVYVDGYFSNVWGCVWCA